MKRKIYKLMSFLLVLLLLLSTPLEIIAANEKPPLPIETKEEVLKKEEENVPEENITENLQETPTEEPKALREEEDSYNLEELKFYLDGEEVSMEENFFQNNYGRYTLNLPRETRKLTVKAVPITKDSTVTVSYGIKGAKVDASREDYTAEIQFEGQVYGNFNSGFKDNIYISVTPKNPPATSNHPRYSITAKVAGYPKPVITGPKPLYVFKQGQAVTREEMMQGVQAIDEVDGNLTEQIKISFWGQFSDGGWVNGKVDTRFIQEDASVNFYIKNAHDQVTTYSAQVKIVKEIPEDVTPPELRGVESKTYYVGDVVDKEKLLEGVTAIDDVDGDITDKIQISPEVINTNIENKPIVTYSVTDAQGNRREKKVIHYVVAKEEQTDKEKLIREIVADIAPGYYSTGEDWEAVDLAIYGKSNLIHKPTLLTKAQQVIKENPKKATEYERITVSLTAAGINATSVPTVDRSRINLIEKIANHEPMGSLNDYIWALLAYDSGNYTVPSNSKWTREKLIDYIVNNQLSDGSWNLENVQGPQVDVDITAMTITALAPYKSDAKVATALNKAVDLLGRIKTKDYAYIYGPHKAETSESSSMVLIALASMGIDPNTDPRFSNGPKSIVDGQLSFVTEGNRFKHVKVFTDGYTPSPNAMATEQGFRALATYLKSQEKGYEPYHAYRFRDFGVPSPDPVPNPNPTPNPEPNPNPDPVDPGDIITLVNLRVIQPPYKTKYKVGETPETYGLIVEATYSNGERETVSNDKLSLYDFNTNTSGYKNVMVQYGGLSTSFTIEVEGNANPEVTATISVVDPKGRTYYSARALEIIEGEDTAFSLLQKTGLTYKYNYHPKYEGVYVSSIEGLAEFDGGPNSGWMYRVNGSFPNYSASLYKLRKGDRVEWLYTRDLGKDLGAPVVEENKGEQSITIRHGEGGYTTPSGLMKVKKGENLTVRIYPNEGYVVDEVKVNGVSMGALTSYTFSNVQGDGRLEATFAMVKKPETPEEINKAQKKLQAESKYTQMTDVVNHWAKDVIKYVMDRGYFQGTSATSFSPNRAATRAEFITVLGRIGKVDTTKFRASKMRDVAQGVYYEGYVNWAVEKGIIQGVGDNRFEPERAMTREEMAVILDKFLAYQGKNYSVSNPKTFADEGSISDWAKVSIDKMTSNGLLRGREKSLYAPKATFTRAEVAQVIYNVENK